MYWFRITLIVGIGLVLVWTLGEVTGILVMCTNGLSLQAMEHDPAKNGTITVYVFILMFQFLLMGFCIFGFVLCILIWKNKFQMDHKLRHDFIIWIGCWVFSLFANMGIAIYALVRNKDPQGQMGLMFEMFQKCSHETRFIASYERYQRENNCCGIYGPDDWLMVQLRSNPGGMSAFQSLDYGFQQNPGTGKCHLIPPTIPPGCGQKIMAQVNSVLNMYAALSMVVIVLGSAVGILAWYCFFYWLDKEVIVIPEDEVSNIIVVEPEPSDTSHFSSSPTNYHPNTLRSGGYLHHGDYNIHHNSGQYLPPGSYLRHGQSIYPHPNSYRGENRELSPSRQRTIVITRSSRYNPDHSRPSRYSRGGEQIYPNSGTSRMHNQSTRVVHRTEHYLNSSAYGRGASYLGHSHNTINRPSRPIEHEHEQHHHETVLEKQEHALGGHLLAEMHVDHDLDKAKDHVSQRPQGQSKHQAHHATIAIVRNKHLHDPPPEPMQHHGHTGHLAEDIAEMSGQSALTKIEDVMIPVNGAHHHPEHQPKKTPVVSLGSVTGGRAQNTIEDIILPEHLKKEKKIHDRQTHKDDLVHAHYLPGMTPPGHSREGGLLASGHESHHGYLNAGHPGEHHPEHLGHHLDHRGGIHNSVLYNDPHPPPLLGHPDYGPGHPNYVPDHGHGHGLSSFTPDHEHHGTTTHFHRPSTSGPHGHHDHDHYLHSDDHDHYLHSDDHDHYLHSNDHDHYLHSDDHSQAGRPELGHHLGNPSRMGISRSRQVGHTDPAFGSFARRDRSTSRDSEPHTARTTVLFKNPHALEESD